MKFGVVIFPGSNCDHDTYHVISKVVGQPVDFIWHKEQDIDRFDAIILPGGFSYGDYLRSGAIARFSPVMRSVTEFARDGGLVLGICNGFQILCETGLLPGALLRNRDLKFICEHVNIRVESNQTPFTAAYAPGQVLSVPIAHGEGNYFCDPQTLNELESEGRIIFRYCDAAGQVTDEANPNGSLNNIAGIRNREGNVMGLMPHPERASESVLGCNDGRAVFLSMADALRELLKARA
ncbi:MAG TPA: phosphoribosylformylglycinamidine synthase subunit PurQ [Blastocatellia bacterium]|nr:phosphoribosylformylglycinamidine synthase subunit PurQ [Blastocatellia bacterium]HMV87036.1 phosphoribosylformylglycinamidine synthase subunit PurQ [Blastocatellia bacterium]HMX26692.1 phosphoribosylformylglycinamidine synthase subunit PurQ [Blastocatellia bacterium]HMY71071.1 phosphoribosylformylglycinamidine synthase subunit PurQ [Blastocatellia bacterium]HMZ17681.1 phosphoribosylformylglycinamidine synthase subunit PurQ [Blastocatellia bacterium]